MANVPELKLLSDTALGETSEEKSDGLGFEAYATVLADAALGTEGPLTIGIFGEWGTGKTSLMRLVRKQVDKRGEALTVWFNPWQFEREDHLIIPLIATIVRKIEGSNSFKNKLTPLMEALRSIANGVAARGKLALPLVGELELSVNIKDMRANADSDPLSAAGMYYDAFEQLSELQKHAKTTIVVFIDDLDRCLPHRAIALLESIKLVLAQPGFNFVMGIARDVIEGYLRHRYVKEYGLDAYGANSYLDKIIQLQFSIPPHTGRVAKLCDSVLERVSEEEREAFKNVLPIVAAAANANPRATVRFVNNLLVDAAINRQLVENEGANEIPIEYFALSRCLDQVWPRVFASLSSSDEMCEAVVKWLTEGFPAGDIDDLRLSELRTVLKENGKLNQLMKTPEGMNWLHNRADRRAAAQFLSTERSVGARSPLILLALNLSAIDQAVILSDILHNFGLKSGVELFDLPVTGKGKRVSLSEEAKDTLRRIMSGGTVLICVSALSDVTTLEPALADAPDAVGFVLLPGAELGGRPLPAALLTWSVFDATEGFDERTMERIAKFADRHHSKRSPAT